jgi:hypothetical protein
MHISTRRIARVCFLALLACGLAALPAPAADKAKKESGKTEKPVKELTAKEKRQQTYIKFLESSGYRPELDQDGDVTFKHEGGNYIIQIDENDDVYFRLLYPNFWDIESEQERSDVLVASTVANANIKCAKVFMVRDNVWAVVEIFLAKPEDYEKLLSRSISTIQSSVNSFRNKMQELKESRQKAGKT